MKRTLTALGLAAACVAPALAQQADTCHPSGYVTGVYSARDDPHLPCDPGQVPRVNGVPQGQAAPTARPNYYSQPQPPGFNGYDPRAMGYRDARDWDRYRDGRYHYGARGPEWRRGGHVPREYMGRQYWVEDWR